jgi:hypothetical protein
MSERAVVVELAAWLRPDAAPANDGRVGDPEVGWDALLDCAAAHQLLPALWSALVRAGLRPLPAKLRDHAGASPLAVLEDAYAANATRVDDLASQGRAVLGALADTGIPAMPIKGLHALLARWWADPAARVMVDIDVLVPEDHIDDAMAAVAELGYRDLGTLDPEGLAAHQQPALGRPGCDGSLELHTAPLVIRHAGLLSGAELFDAADELVVDGRRVPVPSATHAVALLIAHAQLQDDHARLLRLPLRALADTAALETSSVTAEVDWNEVRARFGRRHASPALSGFAVALDELFGVSLPIPRRDGRAWLAATWFAVDHPRGADSYRELVTLPRALAASRMEHLYGADTAAERAVARVRHLSAGVQRRVGRIPGGGRRLRPIGIGAYVMTTPSRADVLTETLEHLAATDWGEEPVIVVDQGLSPRPLKRVELTARALLDTAAVGPHELFLLLEDDLEFNVALRHNLERWPPLVAHRAERHFFGSLYDPNLVAHDAPERATSTYAAVPPSQVYGSQAWLLSRTTARYVLAHWDEYPGPVDIRVSRLAGRVTPLWYHLPSLVQHRPVPSASGGIAHEAPDYDAEWRALDVQPN